MNTARNRFGAILCIVAIAVVLLPSQQAGAWGGDQHRWIVSDAIDYMKRSGNPLLVEAAGWMEWAPGYNSLLHEVNYLEDPVCRQSYSAACALRDEAANTDWYSDMRLKVEPWKAWLRCFMGPIPYEHLDVPYSGIVPWAIACVGSELVGSSAFLWISIAYQTFVELFEDPLDLPSVDLSDIGSFDLTSLNHFINAFYYVDKARRNPDCEGRDIAEQLGYLLKNQYFDFCDGDEEGDCAWESAKLLVLSMIGDSWWLHIDANGAASSYDMITCHDHGFADNPVHNFNSRWMPVDSIAVYGMNAFMYGEDPDLLMVGRALHAVEDVFEPHHNYGFLGRSHQAFESYAGDEVTLAKRGQLAGCPHGQVLCGEDCADRSSDPRHCGSCETSCYAGQVCNRGTCAYGCDPGLVNCYMACVDLSSSTSHCGACGGSCGAGQACEGGTCIGSGGDCGVYSRDIVNEYLELRWPRLFDSTLLTEDIVTGTARKAAFWDHSSRRDDPSNATMADVLLYGEREIDDENGYEMAEMGHNLSVAGTVVLLEKAFTKHYGDWEQAGYCSQLHDDNPADWYITVPGPRVGSSLPSITPEGYYIRLSNEKAESLHPYYNDSGEHPSNRVEIIVPYEYLPAAEIFTKTLEIRLNGRCDWHESEGDRLVIKAKYDDGSSEHWVTEQVFTTPFYGSSKLVRLETGEHGRLAAASVELVHGSHGDAVYVAGDGGWLYRLQGDELCAMETGTNDRITGLWGTTADSMFATTYSDEYDGSVLSYDGNAQDEWTTLRSFERVSTGLWGQGDDLFVLTDFFGSIWHYDGQSWDLMHTFEYYTAPADIWGASASDLFVCGGYGQIYRCEQGECQQLSEDRSYYLNSVWGRREEEVYAVGSGGAVFFFDGSSVQRLLLGVDADLHGVWGDSEDIFIVGDGGLVLHHDGYNWEFMDSGTSMDLNDVYVVPGGAAYAVGEDETVLRYEDGQWTVLHEAPGTTDFHAVWGFEGKCTPERRFGFKIDSLYAELEERETPDDDMAWADDAMIAWVRDMMDGGMLNGLGAFWDCLPPMPCSEDLLGHLRDSVGESIAAGIYLDTGQVFDLTHQALAETFGEQAVSPALTAYALVQAARAVHPQSLIESGLAEKAVLWSLREQGLRSPGRSKGVLSRVVKIDFAKPRVGVRDTLRNADGTVLPGVHPPDLTGYPGFREASDDELADEQSAHAYLQERRMSILQYRLVRELQVAQDNTESLLSILGTDASTEPEVREKVEKLIKAAEWSLQAQERLRQHVVDTDGDGLVDADDLCPGECARGMDVDGDGCIDRGCGLVEELCGVAMWFPARMVLWMKARRACWFEQRGRWRAAAGQLRAFERIARAYARMGWVDEKGAEYLRAYAINARDAALGRLDRLDCP